MTAHYTHIGLQTKVQAIEALPDVASLASPLQGSSLEEQISRLPPKTLTRLGVWLDHRLTESQKAELKRLIS